MVLKQSTSASFQIFGAPSLWSSIEKGIEPEQLSPVITIKSPPRQLRIEHESDGSAVHLSSVPTQFYKGLQINNNPGNQSSGFRGCFQDDDRDHPAALAVRLGQRGLAGIDGILAEQLLDAQELVVFGQTI